VGAESRRLAVLHELGILDTGADERFDRMARLAAAIAETPLAAVTFIDDNRVWFKARVGIEATELEREGSFCGGSVSSMGEFVVGDASLDERFNASALVAQGGVRFYAGFPLVVGGERVGNLAVLDVVPRTLDEACLAAMREVAALAQEAIAQLALSAELARLDRSDRMRSAAMQSLAEGVILFQPSSNMAVVNSAATRILGFDEHELVRHWQQGTTEIADEFGTRLAVEDRPVNRVLAGKGPVVDQLFRWTRGDGRQITLRLTALPVEADEPTLVMSFADVTDEQEAQRALRRYEILFDRSSDVISVISAEGQLLFASPSARTTYGYEPDRVHPQGVFALVHPDDRDRMRAFHERVLAGDAADTAIICRTRTADGRWLYVESVAANLIDDPAIGGVVLTSRDVTDRYVLAQQLEHLATHDRLTGLANRALIDEHLAPALARAARSGRSMALCYIDLDNLKRINDQMGHIAGDEVLVEFTARLRSALREGDLAGRIGGDEFLAVLDSVRDEADAFNIANRILSTVAGPVHLDVGTLNLSASIGVALNRPGDTTDRLMQRSDEALLAAKRAGKSRVVAWSPAAFDD
jgi:diguanylate cyclase (GGDEF)-like protein/PAS domain S-box-containing protein